MDFRVRPPARSLPEAAALLGVETADLAKTLVVRRGADDFLLVVVPGDRQVSWPKLRALLGVNKLSFPDAETARAATGYERGTITVLGAEGDWPVVVDQRLVGRRVAMGSGSHGHGAFVHIEELVRAYAATVADVTGEASAHS